MSTFFVRGVSDHVLRRYGEPVTLPYLEHPDIFQTPVFPSHSSDMRGASATEVAVTATGAERFAWDAISLSSDNVQVAYANESLLVP